MRNVNSSTLELHAVVRRKGADMYTRVLAA